MEITVSVAFFVLYLCSVNAHATKSNGYGYHLPRGGNNIIIINNNINRYGYGGVTSMAQMYCSYCQARGWTTCMQRFCFAGFGPPPTDVSGYGGYGGVTSMAQMYCSYCQARGWSTCVQRFCFAGYGPPPTDVAGYGGGFLSKHITIGICNYCRNFGIWDCVNLFCYGIPVYSRHYAASKHSGRHSQSYYGHLAG
ncbi:hypothetical protein MAR_026589 [Mya arenaria]|uniref:Uncharacterized protein n=1 Tax=Mya arenaria TaxID=6604 RepID=A0ABY7EVH0_MYAAR|nr:uncharacterized protein LOC128242189 [Mya arenaria]WAR12409.1 hypothetical protein MAR_026589 [Mya arenaria]